jgi:type IV pilus assembly protein PilY1
MLHAFTSGVYDADARSFTRSDRAATDAARGGERLGGELWSYIPRALLPHLKWLPQQKYKLGVHVPYVDLKPKVVDARIFESSDKHPNGWGTILIGGLNYGGKYIWTTKPDGTIDKQFYPSFFAIDITDPRTPELLWDRAFPQMGLTVNQPCILQVGRTFNTSAGTWNNDDNWYLAIGSGPDTYDGTAAHRGHVFIVRLKDGALLRDIASPEPLAYMNAPVALDKSMNYNVDAIYVASNYFDVDAWISRIYRIGVPIIGTYTEGLDARYNSDPASWYVSKMAEGDSTVRLPIPYAPFTISLDELDNVWIYIGTGRYLTAGDKSTSVQNIVLGLKDPFYNLRGTRIGGGVEAPVCYHNYEQPSSACTIGPSSIFLANPYAVGMDGTVSGPGIDGSTSFTDFINNVVNEKVDGVEKYQGWARLLMAESPSERVINKPTVIGGLALFPTFRPNPDKCAYNGYSRLYALYYKSGTAYKEAIFKQSKNDPDIDFVTELGYGLSSSIAVHVGREEGGAITLYGQQSTGVITEILVQPAISVRSGLQYWREGRQTEEEMSSD